MAKRAKRASPVRISRMVIRKKRKARTLKARRTAFVTISKQEYEGLKETIHLLSNPANARRLRRAIADADAGKFVEHELIDE
jgi:antitoxin YefM